MKDKILDRQLAWSLLLIFVFAVSVAAQGKAFSFQGRLNDGANPANGFIAVTPPQVRKLP